MEINELQKQARQGNKTAEEELFRLLSARFILFARQRIWTTGDAEEVVQDALKTVFEKYRQVEFETSFVAWAYQVLNNKMMTFLRTKGRREKKLEEMAAERQGRESEPQTDLEKRLLDCLKAVNRANGRHARILNLHYQGFTVPEICGRIGLTRTNFYTILSRARTMLENCLDKGKTK